MTGWQADFVEGSSRPTEPLTNKDLDFSTVRDGWMHTYRGAPVSFINPLPSQIDIEDIAVGLSHMCRYSGQIPKFYSVAEHSIAVAMAAVWYGEDYGFIDDHVGLAALLHDAAEAYMADIPAPLKVLIPDYREIEDRMMSAIHRKFQINWTPRVAGFIHEVDRRILATEIRDLQPMYPDHFHVPYEPFDFTIEHSSDFETVRSQFMSIFHLFYYQGDRVARKSRYLAGYFGG